MIRPLFVIGASRSVTIAAMEYMNQHEEILIGRERYKRNYEQMDPALLTFDRMLDYEPQREGGETNIPREYHVDLLAKKDEERKKAQRIEEQNAHLESGLQEVRNSRAWRILRGAARISNGVLRKTPDRRSSG